MKIDESEVGASGLAAGLQFGQKGSFTAITTYPTPGGGFAANTTIYQLQLGPCVLRNMRIKVRTAPGGVDTVAVTVLVNGVASSLTATITGAATANSDLTNTATLAEGDYVTVKAVSSATVATDLTVLIERHPQPARVQAAATLTGGTWVSLVENADGTTTATYLGTLGHTFQVVFPSGTVTVRGAPVGVTIEDVATVVVKLSVSSGYRAPVGSGKTFFMWAGTATKIRPNTDTGTAGTSGTTEMDAQTAIGSGAITIPASINGTASDSASPVHTVTRLSNSPFTVSVSGCKHSAVEFDLERGEVRIDDTEQRAS